MKVLIIGGGGQVGSKLIALTKQNSDLEIHATFLTRQPLLNSARVYQVDKTNREEIQNLVKKVAPKIVIDTAALHNVDFCEKNKEAAQAVNVKGTKNVAEACKKHGAKMIFISTDYVFDGDQGNYKETDKVNPINYYGTSKLEGEMAVAQSCNDYVIARPSVIYGWISQEQQTAQSASGKPQNFLIWLIQKLKNAEPVRIVTDQYSSPTLADNLAEILLELGKSDLVGIYHASGKTRLNRFDFSVKVAEKLGFDLGLVSPVTSDQFKQVGKRPRDTSLNVDKVEDHLNVKMLSVDEALDVVRDQIEEK